MSCLKTAASILIPGAASGRAQNEGAKAQADASKDSLALFTRLAEQSRNDNAFMRVLGQNSAAAINSELFGGPTPNVNPLSAINDNGDIAPITYGQNGLAAAAGEGGQIGSTPYQGFQASPGYQFRVDEGNKALNNQLASMGLSGSGVAVNEAMRLNQGYATEEYGNYFNRLLSASGAGQVATNATTSAATAGAQGGANALANLGNARASSYQGLANATTQPLNLLAQFAGFGSGGGF